MAERSDTLGSIGISPGHYFRPPRVPTIVSEWAGLSPLVFHLASSQDDYKTAGDVSLLGRFPVTLFPPLGAFDGMARLIERGTKYLDYASTKGGSSQTVWDVKYGGSFPVANGAASASVISQLAKKHNPALEKCYKEPNAPRSQILNIYEFSKNDQNLSSFQALQRTKYWQTLPVVFLVGLCVLFAILGAFGTAAIALTCALSRVFTLIVTFDRPVGYLNSTETHSACMLVAAHQNALEWHLFTGDRGVVDTLLNKPMIKVPERNSKTQAASLWFRVANAAQIIAMTFTAADKGWDGLCLVLLLTAHYALVWLRRQTLAGDWLDQEKITVNTRCLEFSSRHSLIGTIQKLSGANNSRWMDIILEPTARRNQWLRALSVPTNMPTPFDGDVSNDDKERVNNDTKSSLEAIEIAKTLQCQVTPTTNAAKV